MILKIISGAALSIAGLALIIIGTAFIAASGEAGSRLITGAVFSLSGIFLLTPGIRMFRKGMSVRPGVIREKILKLAGKNHGEVPEELITGEIGRSDTLYFQLQRMINTGIAQKSVRDGRTYYLFSRFNMKIAVKQCPYCGNDYPVRDDIEVCSSCGGDLKLSTERKKTGEDVYSMD